MIGAAEGGRPLRGGPARAWAERYAPPPAAELRRIGVSSWSAFVRQSESVTPVIHDRLLDHAGPARLASAQARVLDFGAGVGRIALNLHVSCALPSHACDVNAAAMAYLGNALAGVRCTATPYRPPLPFARDHFDAVYAIGVFTHFPAELEEAWLAELARVLRPGGVALISVCGPIGLAQRRAHGEIGWDEDAAQRLEDDGIVYRDYGPIDQPGIDGPYGAAAHAHWRILSIWNAILPVEAIYPAAIDGGDDLVALVRRP